MAEEWRKQLPVFLFHGKDEGGEDERKRIWKNVGRYALRFVTLLIAISIVSFVLVSLSPVDPVQQYVGAVPNVSMSSVKMRNTGAWISRRWAVLSRGRAPSCTGFRHLPDLQEAGAGYHWGKVSGLSGADADSPGPFWNPWLHPSAASWEIFMENGRIKFSKSCA